MENQNNPVNETRNSRIPTEISLKESPFMQRLTQSTEERVDLAMLHTTKEAFYSIEADILATEKAVMGKEREIEDLKVAFPYNAVNIVNAKQELKGLYEGLEALYELRKEDFGV